MYRVREGQDMKANTFAHLVGTTLYEHRYFLFFIAYNIVFYKCIC